MDKSPPFTQKELAENLKNNVYKKIVFLIGAGVSVGAGIPDFRTPKQGLFANYANYDVPYPEALFEKEYFGDNPQPLYKFWKEFFDKDPVPTSLHFFLRQIHKDKNLSMIFTQNIDGLEAETGIPSKFIINAHGHLRAGDCIKCKKKFTLDEMLSTIKSGKVYYCSCGKPVRPAVLFYEEKLPNKFWKNTAKISESDLVIICGTSLKVSPFDKLVDLVPFETPILVLNKEELPIKRDRLLFLKGDVQEAVVSLACDVGWARKLEVMKDEYIEKKNKLLKNIEK